MNDIFHFAARLTIYDVILQWKEIGKNCLSRLPPFAPKLLCLLLNLMNNSVSLNKLKTRINRWKTDHYPWRLCKKHVGRGGFI